MIEKDILLRLEAIRKEHQDLDDEVDMMNKIRVLTPSERSRLKELKVMRLNCRDTIDRLVKKSFVKSSP